MNTYKVVTHAHSLYSYDGTLSLKEIKENSIINNVQIVMMSEHAHKGMNKKKYLKFLDECNNLSDDDFLFIPGLEFNSKDGPHIIIYGMTDFVDLTGASVEEIYSFANENNYKTTLVHPMRQSYEIREYLDKVHYVEGFSSNYDKIKPYKHLKFLFSLKGKNKKIISGVDLHLYVQFEDFEVSYNQIESEKKLSDLLYDEVLGLMVPFFYGFEMKNRVYIILSFLKSVFLNKMVKRAKFSKIKRLFKRRFIQKTNIQPEELKLGEKEKVLIFSPHPDDESIGCGGLILSYPKQVKVICVSDGRHGGGHKINEVIRMRKKELIDAMSFAEAELQFLNIPDGDVINKLNFDNIDYSHISRVFIPHFEEQHHDHLAVVKCLQRQLKYNKALRKKMDGIKICFYEVWNPLSIVNEYLDISNKVDKKVRLINFHASQIKIIDYSERIKALAFYRGMSTGKNYSECYMSMSVDEFMEL